MTDSDPSGQIVAQPEPQIGCKCIQIINEAFARNGRAVMVDTALIWNQKTDTETVRIAIRCAKMDGRDRKRAPALIADYCPLCGTRYVPLAAAPPDTTGVGQ